MKKDRNNEEWDKKKAKQLDLLLQLVHCKYSSLKSSTNSPSSSL